MSVRQIPCRAVASCVVEDSRDEFPALPEEPSAESVAGDDEDVSGGGRIFRDQADRLLRRSVPVSLEKLWLIRLPGPVIFMSLSFLRIIRSSKMGYFFIVIKKMTLSLKSSLERIINLHFNSLAHFQVLSL